MVSIVKKLAESTAITAIAADSRQRPARVLDTAAESTMPKTKPIAVDTARSDRKCVIGVVNDALPLTTTPANASASTAPVGSFNADSAITAWETLGRSR